MLIYIFFLGLIITADSLKIQSKFLFFSIIFLVGLFLCFGYMTGSDWRAYELDYENLKNNIYYDRRIEFGYFIYMFPFVALGFDFWHFIIFTKVVLYLIICYFIKKYIPDNFYFAFAIFYCFIAIFIFIDNPMRYLIASTLYLFTFKYIIEKKLLKYIIICLISFLFHKSFLLMFPLYFFLNIRFKTKYVVFTFLAFNVLIFLFSEQLILLFKSIDLLNSFSSSNMREKISGYVLSDDIKDKQFSYGLLSKYIIFIILILFKNKIESFSKYGNIAFNSSILSLIILRFALIWPVTVRFVIPLSIFFCVSLAMVISTSSGIRRMKYYSIIIIIYIGTLYSQITSAYKYIPYSNYLSYLTSDKPSYTYRSNYNYTHSPYKDKSAR